MTQRMSTQQRWMLAVPKRLEDSLDLNNFLCRNFHVYRLLLHGQEPSLAREVQTERPQLFYEV